MWLSLTGRFPKACLRRDSTECYPPLPKAQAQPTYNRRSDSAAQKVNAPEHSAPRWQGVSPSLSSSEYRLVFQFHWVRGENVLAAAPVLFAHVIQLAQTWVRVRTWSTPRWNRVLQSSLLLVFDILFDWHWQSSASIILKRTKLIHKMEGGTKSLVFIDCQEEV